MFWLAVWQLAALWTDNSILLVGPVQVAGTFVRNMVQPDFLKTVFCSLTRIGLGFFLALCLGLAAGALAYRFPLFGELCAPVMAALKSIPVASFVVLLLIWFGSSRLSFLISFLIVFPNVYLNTEAGLQSTDRQLLEMAQVFGMGAGRRWFYLYRPALMPYLESCLRVSLGMSWKSGVAAEVIGLPDFSLGERLYMSKIYLDTAGLFAWTLTVILLSFLFEKAVLGLVGRFARWKPYPVLRGGKAGRRREPGGALRISHVDKAFGEQTVLRDYSLTVPEGGRYLLMAPSGAGKTTLLRILTGLDHADGGQITGVPSAVGMVFQEDRLCEEYDALCNIMLGMAPCRGSAGEILRMVRREAAQILPEDCLTKPVKELSGGMRRRVSLLRAVLSPGRLLLLDEPFTGLDEETREKCGGYLLRHLEGRTLLAATHREEDAALLDGVKVTLVIS